MNKNTKMDSFYVPFDLLGSVCRVCLLETENMLPLGEVYLLHNIGTKKAEKVELNDFFEKYCNVKLLPDDQKPSKICEGCIASLGISFNFLETLIESDKLLDKFIQDQNEVGNACWKSEVSDSAWSDVENDFLNGISNHESSDELFEDIDKKRKNTTRVKKKLKQPKKVPPIKDGETISCGFCKETFTDIHKLVEHYDERHDDKEICPICNESRKRYIKYHIGTHSKDKNFSCEPCRQYFPTEEKFKAHREDFDHDNPGKCHICNKEFDTSFKRNRHMRMHYQTENIYSCDKCGKSFRYRASLYRHNMKHTNPKRFLCSFCGRSYGSKYIMLRHIKDKHEGDANQNPDGAAEPPPRKRKNVKRKPDDNPEIRRRRDNAPRRSRMGDVKCEYCDAVLPSTHSLAIHRQRHPEFCDYPCRICKAQFTTRDALREHIDTIHTRHLCQICGKGFPYKSSLERHHNEFHKLSVGKYCCNICGLRFGIKTAMEQHLLKHTGEKPYECQVCSKRFAQRAHLNVHMYQHTGRKPHKCEYCGKAFTYRREAVVHERIHTGEKPYPCCYCNKSFRDSVILIKHKRKAHPDLNLET